MKMVASEGGGKCKKHPEQEELPGVCSDCLRERLSQLYGFKSQEEKEHVNMMMGTASSASSSLSSSPPYSSASSSTHISPNRPTRGPAGNHHHRRRPSEVTAKISMVIGAGGLKKSRSIAVVPSGRGGGGDGKTKKVGFWSKLLGSRGRFD